MSEEEQEEIYQDMIFEQPDTRYEIISMCNSALSAVEGIDIAIISKQDMHKIKEIKRKCLALIDLHIGMLYDEYIES